MRIEVREFIIVIRKFNAQAAIVQTFQQKVITSNALIFYSNDKSFRTLRTVRQKAHGLTYHSGFAIISKYLQELRELRRSYGSVVVFSGTGFSN